MQRFQKFRCVIDVAALGKPFGQRDGLVPVGFQVRAGDAVAFGYSGRVILL